MKIYGSIACIIIGCIPMMATASEHQPLLSRENSGSHPYMKLSSPPAERTVILHLAPSPGQVPTLAAAVETKMAHEQSTPPQESALDRENKAKARKLQRKLDTLIYSKVEELRKQNLGIGHDKNMNIWDEAIEFSDEQEGIDVLSGKKSWFGEKEKAIRRGDTTDAIYCKMIAQLKGKKKD